MITDNQFDIHFMISQRSLAWQTNIQLTYFIIKWDKILN